MTASRLGLAIMLAATAIAVTACGSNSSDDSVQSSEEAAAAQADAATTRLLRQDYGEGFWNIASLRPYWAVAPSALVVSSGTIEAHTTWYYDDEGKETAFALCAALRGNFVLGGNYDASDVIVTNSDGLILAHSFSEGDCHRG